MEKLRCSAEKVDNNRKIAVFGIGKHVVDEDDSGLIKVAVLGNSKKVAQGDAVIALGNILDMQTNVLRRCQRIEL